LKKEHVFGCAEIENGMFYDQEADGIIGIGVKGDIHPFNPPNIIDSELAENRIATDIVSLCLS